MKKMLNLGLVIVASLLCANCAVQGDYQFGSRGPGPMAGSYGGPGPAYADNDMPGPGPASYEGDGDEMPPPAMPAIYGGGPPPVAIGVSYSRRWDCRMTRHGRQCGWVRVGGYHGHQGHYHSGGIRPRTIVRESIPPSLKPSSFPCDLNGRPYNGPRPPAYCVNRGA